MLPHPYDSIPPELLTALLENPHESTILVDAAGIIRFISAASEEFFGMSQEEAVGKHILVLNPESKLPRVLKTGKAEIGRVLRMGEKDRFVARIPLRDRQGRVVGAAGKLILWRQGQVGRFARELELLKKHLDYYQKELQHIYRDRYSLGRIVGESPALLEAKQVAAQAAESDLAVLITGETGTGKELFAHAIHQLSARRKGPFIKVNCAAIPSELFESELFGYEAGAFTGASRQGKAGKFEMAEGGTIFLDEIGDLPLNLQVKILRVLQEQEVERLGGTRARQVDFRVVAATNRDLAEMLAAGSFRQDLYYRLNIFHLLVPALREAPEDIPRLVHHILSELRAAGRLAPERVSPAAMGRLVNHPWPGNVRELRNVLERAAVVAGDGELKEAHLPAELTGPAEAPPDAQQPLPLRKVLAAAERRALRQALDFCGGNRSQAARVLGIHRTGLYQKLRRHAIKDI